MLSREPVLGTRAEVAVAAPDGEAAEHAVLDEVARLEAIFSAFDPASELHRYRRSGTTDVAELRTVIDLAAEWQTTTGGAFHPGAQPLVDLWDHAEAAGVVPTDDEVAAAAASVRDADPTPTINLNAIAKGWIADHALTTTLAATPGASGGWISLGGDIVHRGKGTVRVGIEDPKRPYDNVAPLAWIDLADEALATSGSGRRWWNIAGQRYSKVLDPRTGRPVDRVASATVVAPDGAAADVLATVAVVLGPEATLALVAECGAACFLVHHDGTTAATSDRFRPS